jgi:hypothetical protein
MLEDLSEVDRLICDGGMDVAYAFLCLKELYSLINT